MAAALTAGAALLVPLPAHAASGTSTTPTSSASPTTSGKSTTIDPDARAPKAADARDQDEVNSLWERLKNWIIGDGQSSDEDGEVAEAGETDSDEPGPFPTTGTDDAALPETANNTNLTGAATPGTGGSTMPKGDLPGWQQVIAENFTIDTTSGGFPGSSYAARWSAYDGFSDSSGAGTYSASRVLSAHDGVLDMNLRTEDGRALVAAPVPLLDGAWGGWTYGRYSVRFRADAVAGYKTAWLLWPDSDDWNDGEIDFPEGDLDETSSGYVHQPGNPSHNALAVDTSATFASWNTATIEWLPTGVTFLLDGHQVGSTTVSPNKPMHLVLQTETAGGQPSTSAAGHVQVDWVTAYRVATK